MDFFAGAGDDDYWGTPGQDEIYEDSAISRERIVFFESILARAETLVPRGALLDVGAGKGEFACLAVGRGWDVAVLEPSDKATAGLLDKGISRVHNSPFETFVPSRLFDCVTMLDFLEHVFDPAAAIAKAAECLRPGGVLVALTPDGASPARRLALSAAAVVPACKAMLKYQYYLPHVCYLSERSLRAVSTAAGLETVFVARAATPRRFLLAKLKRHYGKYPGSALFRAAVAVAYPLASLCLKNKLMVAARKPS